MNWSRYEIVGDGGFRYEIVIGDWLKEGEYSFGTVRKLEELGNDEFRVFHEMEQGLYYLWYDMFLLSQQKKHKDGELI